MRGRVPNTHELAHGVQPPQRQCEPTIVSAKIDEPLELTMSYRDINDALAVLGSLGALGQGAEPLPSEASAAELELALATSDVNAIAPEEAGDEKDRDDTRTVASLEIDGINMTLVNDSNPRIHVPLLSVDICIDHSGLTFFFFFFFFFQIFSFVFF